VGRELVTNLPQEKVKSMGYNNDDDDDDSPSPPASVAASPYWSTFSALDFIQQRQAAVAATKEKESADATPTKDAASSVAVATFSPFVAFCFTINYILGTGFLTIPWAFTEGGLLLSSTVIFLVGIFSDMAKNYLLETMARSEVMLDDQLHWKRQSERVVSSNKQSNKTLESNTEEEEYIDSHSHLLLKAESCPLASIEEGHRFTSSSIHTNYEAPTTNNHVATNPTYTLTNSNSTTTKQQEPSLYMVQERKFEVNTLCRIYLGKTGVQLYTLFICLYIYCALWAFTSVFSSALAKSFPVHVSTAYQSDNDHDNNHEFNTSYTIYAVLYATIVVPLTCMELHEQVMVQLVMALARFLLLFLMVSTSLLCHGTLDKCFDKENADAPSPYAPAPLVRLSGIHKMLPIMVFANIYQHGVPDLAQPVRNKEQLKPIFQATTLFVTCSFALIGLFLGSTFGQDIEQSVNLNWKGFTGGTGTAYNHDGQISVAWWAKAIELFILCFPALDVISAFPLNAITLGNNMMGAFYGTRYHDVQHNRCIRIRFRLLASIPPIVCGIFERHLGTITDYAGTTGFIMGFSFPALLYLKSKQVAILRGFSVWTYYSSYASRNPAAWLLFLFGICMFVYVLYCLVLLS
jgi:amino acid permease